MFTAVEDLMSREPITLSETDDVAMAWAIINHRRIRHLPVVRQGKLLGLITSQSLLP